MSASLPASFATPRTPRQSSHPSRPDGERQRRLLRELVASNPGVHVLRAAALLGLNWNSCLYHVRRLEARQEIVSRKVAGRVCLFDRREGAVGPQLGPLLLRQGRNTEIARAILRNPGMNQKSLAEAVGMAPSVVHRRLVQFEGAGLVQRVPTARSVAVYATNTLQSSWNQDGLVPATPAAPAGSLPENSVPAVPFMDVLAGVPAATNLPWADASA